MSGTDEEFGERPVAERSRVQRESLAARSTIIDVARAARVSPATVSNTLNNRPNVDDATRKRVLAAVRKLGYTPNLRARRLRTGRADTIALFSSMTFALASGPGRLGFMMEVAATAAACALEKGVALVLVPPLNSGHTPFRDLHLDGAIVSEPLENDPEITLLLSRGVTVVSIGRQLGHTVVPFVDVQPYEASCTAIKHLYERSSGKLGLIVGAQPRFTHRQAEQAYRDFMRVHRGNAVMQRVDEAAGSDGAYEATKTMLSQHPELDALFVSVDVFAAGAQRAAMELGIDIPGKLKIATRYDGLIARESKPPLTALNLHLDQLASLAVDLLFEHMSGRSARMSVVGPVATLVARESSGAH